MHNRRSTFILAGLRSDPEHSENICTRRYETEFLGVEKVTLNGVLDAGGGNGRSQESV